MSSSLPNPDDFVRLLICPDCQESYNFGDKKPRFLRCFHSICDVCLQQTLRRTSEITCNQCSFVTQTPAPVPESFQLNNYMMNLMALFQYKVSGGIGLREDYVDEVLQALSNFDGTSASAIDDASVSSVSSGSVPRNGGSEADSDPDLVSTRTDPEKKRLKRSSDLSDFGTDGTGGPSSSGLQMRRPSDSDSDDDSTDSSDDSDADGGDPNNLGFPKRRQRLLKGAQSIKTSDVSSSVSASRRVSNSNPSAAVHPDLARFAKPVALKRDQEDEDCPVCLEKMVEPSSYPLPGYLDDCVVTLPCNHLLHHNCVYQSVSAKKEKFFKCPTCNFICGTLTGTQPPNGTMAMRFDAAPSSSCKIFGVGGDDNRLPGFEKSQGTFVISYNFRSGVQGPEHPSPGHHFHAQNFPRVAYLPATHEGYLVLCMLKIAFDRRLTFTIGTSATTGQQNQLIWNNIHHKTSKTGGSERFGYPDPGYLGRVTEELAALGVTPADIPPDPKQNLGIPF